MNYAKLSIHNDVNGAGTSGEGLASGRCPIGQLGGSGRHHATAENPRETQCKLVSCRKRTIISTFNTRTLNPSSRLSELVRSAKDKNIDIIAIQEHRFFHPDKNIEYHKIEDYHLITASSWKNSVNASVGGVGFLFSPAAMENVLHIEKISPRIIVADFKGNPTTTVISCYSPHNSSSEEELHDFYNILRSSLELVPAHNFLLVAGDFNAKLGTDDVKYAFHLETNRNGEQLVDLAEEFGLLVSNTRFKKNKNQLWTFEYPNGSRAQLDFIMVRKKWHNSVKDCRAYSSFSSVGSDHRIVSASVKLSLRVSKKATADPMKSIDWKSVQRDKDLSTQYTVNVLNRFQELTGSSALDSTNIDLIYGNLIKANEEIALSTLPKKDKSKRKIVALDSKVIDARAKLRKFTSDYHCNPSQSNKKKITEAKKYLDQAYLEVEEAYIKGEIAKISHLHINQQHSAAWKTINQLAGKNSQPTTSVKGGSREQRLANWHLILKAYWAVPQVSQIMFYFQNFKSVNP